MIRVALITEQLRRPTPGGIGRYATCLHDALRSRSDVDVEAVQGRLPTEITTRIWSAGFPRYVDADIVHATSFSFPRTVGRARTTVFIHDVLWRGAGLRSLTARGLRFHERGLKLALSRADRILVPSFAVRDALVAGGVGANAVVVTGEGADHLPVRPRALGGSVVLSVGTLEPRKNLPRLLAAFDDVRRRMNDPVVLRIVGSNSWRAEPGLPAELPDGVELIGSVTDEQLAELFASATAFVFPSMGEGYGLPPVEAMRAGVPVVCAPVPSVVESLTDGGGPIDAARQAFESIDPTDVASIARGLERVLRSDERRSELTARGFDWASGRTWANVAQRHMDLWAALK